jgi:hypothetical protein
MYLAATARQLSKPYRVDEGKSCRLRDVDPADTAPFESEKNWMFRARDVAEHENAIRETASEEAPWYVVPADHERFTRLVVGAAIVEALAGIGLHYPKGTVAQRRELAAARRALARG